MPGEGEDEEVAEISAPAPTMYRWVSRAQPAPTANGDGAADDTPAERTMALSFSVPAAVLPSIVPGDGAMQVDDVPPTSQLPPPRSSPPHCDVQGCTAIRKYRLVRDFEKGACGMGHLKVLEAQTV